eukprot:Gb_30747 [translate_table: standard]
MKVLHYGNIFCAWAFKCLEQLKPRADPIVISACGPLLCRWHMLQKGALAPSPSKDLKWLSLANIVFAFGHGHQPNALIGLDWGIDDALKMVEVCGAGITALIVEAKCYQMDELLGLLHSTLFGFNTSRDDIDGDHIVGWPISQMIGQRLCGWQIGTLVSLLS